MSGSYLSKKARGFWEDEAGTAVIETAIIFPMLITTLVAMTVFFDAFRVKSVNLKAAYTISDMASRVVPILTPDFVDGLGTMYQFLSGSGSRPTWIRLTLVRFKENDPDLTSDDEYIIEYSYGTNGELPQTDATLVDIKSKIPKMVDGDTTYVMETHMRYQPTFNIGLNAYDLDHVIMTRPRSVPACWVTCIN